MRVSWILPLSEPFDTDALRPCSDSADTPAVEKPQNGGSRNDIAKSFPRHILDHQSHDLTCPDHGTTGIASDQSPFDTKALVANGRHDDVLFPVFLLPFTKRNNSFDYRPGRS